MRARGTGSIYRRGRVWWVKYYANGQPRRESSHSEDKSVATHLLKIRHGEFAFGKLLTPSAGRITVGDLAPLAFRDYEVHARLSLRTAKCRWKAWIEPFFGTMRATALSTAVIDAYVDSRRRAGAANGTINRELALLRRMLSLAASTDPPIIPSVPRFPRLHESAPRAGFVTQEQYESFQAAAGEPWLRCALALWWTYGFRRAEVLNMRVYQADLASGTIVLNPGTTKSGEGRVVKMSAEVRDLVALCAEGKDQQELLLTRSGRRIGDFRKTWHALATAAGCPGTLVHDFRRSAAINLRRAGVPEKVIMRIAGWKTRAVFDRYNILEESDLLLATESLERAQIRAQNGAASR